MSWEGEDCTSGQSCPTPQIWPTAEKFPAMSEQNPAAKA